jgi:S-(hydroxymethyl)glutathione dehydrogenase / alcohol dehydrogenase
VAAAVWNCDAETSHVADPDNVDELIAAIAPEGADVALDLVGRTATTATALRLTRSGGTTVIVGLPPAGEELRLDFAEFNRREKWLTGTMYGSENPADAMPQLLAYVRSGQLNLAAMTGPRYPLDRVNEALEASMAGVPARVIVMPN